ncbi:MAG: cytochrome [Cyanobacteria bacterium P01_A01_bin.135]
MSYRVVGVMGPGEGASEVDYDAAYELGRGIATCGWVLLSGGRDAGVMQAANRGAKAAGGLTLGILPDKGQSRSPQIDIAVKTAMGSGRNWLNILSSDAIVVCGLGLGTLSELALALKQGIPTLLLAPMPELVALLQKLPAAQAARVVETPQGAIAELQKLLLQ